MSVVGCWRTEGACRLNSSLVVVEYAVRRRIPGAAIDAR